MEMPRIRHWRDEFPGEPSKAFLEKLFVPSGKYRIVKFSYPVGTNFAGSGVGPTAFILEGCGRYVYGGVKVFLSKGDFAELPGGDYFFSVIGDLTVEIVLVWNLSEMFKRYKETSNGKAEGE